MSVLSPGDDVRWAPLGSSGQIGRIVAMSERPSALVEFPDGSRVMLDPSALEKTEPVPPLPTEPSVIRVTWLPRYPNEPSDVLAFDGKEWVTRYHTLRGPELSSRITGFEVLAEPRALTAKAVLDRVESIAGYDIKIVATVRREFGVES